MYEVYVLTSLLFILSPLALSTDLSGLQVALIGKIVTYYVSLSRCCDLLLLYPTVFCCSALFLYKARLWDLAVISTLYLIVISLPYPPLLSLSPLVLPVAFNVSFQCYVPYDPL